MMRGSFNLFISNDSQNPFVSSVVETPIDHARLHRLSTTLEANGAWVDALATLIEANERGPIHV